MTIDEAITALAEAVIRDLSATDAILAQHNNRIAELEAWQQRIIKLLERNRP